MKRAMAFFGSLLLLISFTACSPSEPKTEDKKEKTKEEVALEEARAWLKEQGKDGDHVALLDSEGEVIIEAVTDLEDFFSEIDPSVKEFENHLKTIKTVEKKMEKGNADQSMIDELNAMKDALTELVLKLVEPEIPASALLMYESLMESIQMTVGVIEYDITYIEAQMDDDITFETEDWLFHKESVLDDRDQKIENYQQKLKELKSAIQS